jgi:hypothetical protein
MQTGIGETAFLTLRITASLPLGGLKIEISTLEKHLLFSITAKKMLPEIISEQRKYTYNLLIWSVKMESLSFA